MTKTYYSGHFRKQPFNAVDKVSFGMTSGETLGLVGESGCGKSTLGRMILRLIPSTSGQIVFKGQDITHAKGNKLKCIRKNMQIVFQSPQSALNPHIRVWESVCEPMRVQGFSGNHEEQLQLAVQLMEMVGLDSKYLYRYPRELSGGQIQRVALARILSLQPELIIADEPTSMLDVSVQAQVLQWLNNIKKEHQIACLFISHDLDVVRCMSDRIAVMCRGQIVELGPTEDITRYPRHPYTQLLVDLFFGLEKQPMGLGNYVKDKIRDKSPDNRKFCSFYPYCPRADKDCLQQPEPNKVGADHFVSCFKI